MTNEKPNYQPWNEDQFFADIRVRTMPAMPRFFYKFLLNAAFFHSTRPYLPVDDDTLWMLAGCDGKQMWLDHKVETLKMFETFVVDGVELLGQKRLIDDWNRIVRKRDTLSENGSKGGKSKANAKQMLPVATEDVSKTEASKSKSKQESEPEEEQESGTENLDPLPTPLEEQTTDKDESMKAKKELPILCLGLFGVKAETWDSTWAEIKVFEQVYGSGQVIQAFKDWAEPKVGTGEIQDKPITQFLKVADGILRGIIPVGRGSHELSSLVGDLMDARRGEIAFNTGQKQVLTALLASHTAADILAVFKEFYEKVQGDDFLLKMAPKNFVEQAEDLLQFRYRRQKKASDQAKFIEDASVRMREEADAELAEIKRRDAEEAELVEDTLG